MPLFGEADAVFGGAGVVLGWTIGVPAIGTLAVGGSACQLPIGSGSGLSGCT
jgi:hypothetical protein